MKRNPRRHNMPPAHVKHALFRAAEEALKKNGWTVSREPKARGTSLRRIEKTGDDGKTISHVIGIRTSQNGSLAFTRDQTETVWVGLSDAKFILVSCVDDFKAPRRAILHLFDGGHLKTIFSSEYAKRKKAGVRIKPETGFFLPVHQFPPISGAKIFGGKTGILERPEQLVDLATFMQLPPDDVSSAVRKNETDHLTIPEARRRLARSLGVDEKHISIKIMSPATQISDRRRSRRSAPV